MADKIALGIPCEICGNDSWWDNRQNKKNPKSPDYKCGNRDCKDTSGYPCGRWEKDRSKWGGNKPAPKAAEAEPKGGRLTGDDTTPDERGEVKVSYEALVYTYGVLYQKLLVMMAKSLGPETPVDQNALQAGVATLLIQGEKARIPLLHPRKAQPVPLSAAIPPKPPRQAHPPALDDVPEGLDGEDWEPPF